jgi:hypothetical protein
MSLRAPRTHPVVVEEIGAGDGIRTRDIDLGKVALYQLSYSRSREGNFIILERGRRCQTVCNPLETKALKIWLQNHRVW